MQIELKLEFFKSILNKDTDRFKSFKKIDNQFVLRKEVINYSLELIQKTFSLDKDTSIILSPNDKKILNSFKTDTLKDVSALGLHLFDEITGRYSYMNKFRIFENHAIESSRFNELYSKIWLRIYNELLRPNSSLINFFYDNEDIWEDEEVPLHLMWDEHDDEGLKKLEDNEICLNFSKRFISENSKIAEEISTLIQGALNGVDLELTLDDKSIINLVFFKILPELNAKSIRERLSEIVFITRIELLNHEVIRKDFFKKIELLSFKRGQDNTDVVERGNFSNNEMELWLNMPDVEKIWSDNNNVRHSWSWPKVNEMLEAFQSTILNQFSFCDDKGLSLYKLSGVSPKYNGVNSLIHGNLIIVSDCKKSGKVISRSFENCLKALRIYINNIEKELIRPAKIGATLENSLVDNISRKLSVILGDRNAVKNDVLVRWSSILYNISSESIHERKNIEFLVGIGPKSFHEVHFKKYVLPFDYLTSSNADIIKIVHFIKSYFSLFEVKNKKIIWFDEQGHFLGIYEFNSLSEILANGNKKPIFLASIKGKKSFDILHNSKSPIIRINNGKYIDFNEKEVSKRILKVTKKVFLDTKQIKLINNFSKLITCVVNETIIIGSGTSFIILNDLNSINLNKNMSDWKVKFEFQSKNLSERLEKYKSPVLSKEDLEEFDEEINQDLIDSIIKEILLLTKLDGSILIRLSEEGVFVNPSQFTVPLIKKEGESKELEVEHFDYFELRSKGKKYQSRSVANQMEEINNKFYKNSATTHKELQMFIADIGYQGPFNIDNEDNDYKNLTFLNSSGTRHHSLYGLSLSVKEPLYVVVISEDGKIRILWNGLIFYTDSQNND